MGGIPWSNAGGILLHNYFSNHIVRLGSYYNNNGLIAKTHIP